MTPPSKQAAMIREQRASGEENGEAIANIIIKQFPFGWADNVGRKIRRIERQALAHVIDSFTAAGVGSKYKSPFANGFKSGLARAYLKHAALLLGTKQIG
jgi:hypothetical protein